MQTQPDLKKVLRAAVEATKIGEKILTGFYGRLKQVNEKDQAGLVSEADLESEKAIAKYLRSEFPDFDILGEEGSFANPDLRRGLKAPGRWVIDPLDGTTNYVHQFPIYCISIGFEWLGEAVAGAINVPTLARMYTGTKGGGAFCNGESLRVSTREGLSNSLMATGFSSYNKAALNEQLAIFSRIVSQARGVRRAGSAAIDLCLVAEGVFDGYWEKNLQAWDVCAGALFVKEAGGVATNFVGKDFDTNEVDIVVGNPNVHRSILQVIKDINSAK